MENSPGGEYSFKYIFLCVFKCYSMLKAGDFFLFFFFFFSGKEIVTVFTQGKKMSFLFNDPPFSLSPNVQ